MQEEEERRKRRRTRGEEKDAGLRVREASSPPKKDAGLGVRRTSDSGFVMDSPNGTSQTKMLHTGSGSRFCWLHGTWASGLARVQNSSPLRGPEKPTTI